MVDKKAKSYATPLLESLDRMLSGSDSNNKCQADASAGASAGQKVPRVGADLLRPNAAQQDIIGRHRSAQDVTMVLRLSCCN